ncbi:hypothetical protein BJX99DRAFT_254554 [Aspergillus californicus]
MATRSATTLLPFVPMFYAFNLSYRVDWPGLMSVSVYDEGDADLQLVNSLVDGYMVNTRSIILAIVKHETRFRSSESSREPGHSKTREKEQSASYRSRNFYFGTIPTSLVPIAFKRAF